MYKAAHVDPKDSENMIWSLRSRRRASAQIMNKLSAGAPLILLNALTQKLDCQPALN